MQTIILRAQRPIVLTGGPFYALSLETFRAVSKILRQRRLDICLLKKKISYLRYRSPRWQYQILYFCTQSPVRMNELSLK